MSQCVYLGEPTGIDKCEQPSRHCHRLGCYVVEGVGKRTVPGCKTCKERLLFDDSDFSARWQDPLEVIDRRRQRTDAARDLLAGASVFLACSGPSANDLPLEELSRRGIWTMAVNNMAGHERLRPQAFVCSDPPLKFSHSIWLDPAIMKWVPTPKMSGKRARLKRKKEDGKFEQLDRTVPECPNVWGFRRDPWMWPDERFFTSNGAPWGNLKVGVEKTGQPKTVNTMLLAIRVLRYLGAKRVFLIGADFRMSKSYGYAFPQDIANKDQEGRGISRWDNDQYAVVNDWLCQMQKKGVFEKFGMEVYNCYRNSSLRAFPFVNFSDAIIECKGIVEDVPDLSEWYEKK